jgi:hypothetical protein
VSEKIEPEPLPVLVEGRLIGHLTPDRRDAAVIAGLFVPAPDFAFAGRLYEEAARLAALADEGGWDLESAVGTAYIEATERLSRVVVIDGTTRGIREFEVFPDGRVYVILQADNPQPDQTR